MEGLIYTMDIQICKPHSLANLVIKGLIYLEARACFSVFQGFGHARKTSIIYCGPNSPYRDVTDECIWGEVFIHVLGRGTVCKSQGSKNVEASYTSARV